MTDEEISMEDKFALIQKLLSPTGGSIFQQPVVLALKPFDPDEIIEIQVVGSWQNSTITTTDRETGERDEYLGVHGVNFLVREHGWKIVAMLLITRENHRGQAVQDLVTVLILPKTNTTSKEPVKLKRTRISHQQKSALPLNWIEPVQLEHSVAEAIIEKLTPMAARQIQQLLIDNQNQPTYGVYTSVRRQANRLLAANVEWNHLRFADGIEGAQLWKVTPKT